MEQPLVSVVMPMRNAGPFVREALRSILDQDYRALQVVVIDDGSTDDSAAVVRSLGDPRIEMIPGPQAGISAAFNAGLAAARGEILMRCDADDRYPAGRIARQVAFLQGHPEHGAICGAYMSITPKGAQAALLATEHPEEDITDALRAGQTRTHLCTFAMRTDLLRGIGGCRRAFVTAEDIDLQLRLCEVGRVHFSPVVSYEYRLHDASVTHTQADNQRRFYEQLARDCRQERAAGGEDCVARGEVPTPPTPSGGNMGSASGHAQGQMIGQAWRQHRDGDRLGALLTGARAVAVQPRSLGAWRSLVMLGLKRPGNG